MYFGHNAELLGFNAEAEPPVVHTSVGKSLEAFRNANLESVIGWCEAGEPW